MMMDDEIIQALRARRGLCSAVEMAEYLETLTDGELTAGKLITYFKRAFPAIPLQILRDAEDWSRVGTGSESDEWLNELLRPWLGPNS